MVANVYGVQRAIGLEAVGFDEGRLEGVNVHWNLIPAELYEEALRNGEGELTDAGALRVLTGEFTGRSPKDKFIVRQDPSSAHIWWGTVNAGCAPETFARLHRKVLTHLEGAKNLYVQDAYVGADPTHRLPIRVISEVAYHALFAWNMFLRVPQADQADHTPQFTVLAAPTLTADPQEDGTRTGTFIVINLEERLILIGGTLYSGEVKKGIFTVMNYLLPFKDVMPMHCSANAAPDGDNVALFFGLSGTGKTTLSADASRMLIGDDEHGWGADGVFNFEGGCYAKTINLSPQGEPEIFATTQRFGTILENVVLRDDRTPNFADASLTENTRCSYPLHYIENASPNGCAKHPRTIIFLTADAYGVLPPIARLTPAQAMYHFMSGYTAKVAGTERGILEPTATFSACFGAPFMPLHPSVYAELLAEKIKRHHVRVFLINTGWNGRKERIKLAYTRRMVNAVLNGELDDAPTTQEPYFGLAIPQAIVGIPQEVLDPRTSWADVDAYHAQAMRLVGMFNANFEKFDGDVNPDILQGAPLM